MRRKKGSSRINASDATVAGTGEKSAAKLLLGLKPENEGLGLGLGK